MMKRSLAALVVLGAICQMGAVEAAVANSTPVFELEKLVVTANRFEKKKIDVPANVNVITASEIEKRGYKSVVEAIADVPGAIVKNGGYGASEKYIKLNGDDRVLVMLDGHLMNLDKGAASGHGGFDAATLPDPEIIERIEVVKGAGTAMYGSNAVGGVINIITKKPESDYVKLDVGMGSFNTYQYNGIVSGRRKDYGMVLYGGTYHQKDIKYKDAATGNTLRMSNSAWELDTFGVKLDKKIKKDQLLTLHYQHTFRDGGMPGGMRWFDEKAHGNQLNNNISLRYDWNTNKKNSGFINIYHNFYKGEYHSSYEDNEYKENKNGFEAQQQFSLSRKNNMTAGVAWRRSSIESTDYTAGSKELDNKSVFINDNWEIDKNWLVTAGLRYDKHNVFGGKVTGAAAVNRTFGAKAHAYINWGQVFNAPQGNDLYWSSYGMRGNPNLRAESGDVWTIGYDMQASDKTSWGINFFRSNLKDAIRWHQIPTTTDYTVDNIDVQKRQGMEISFSHKFSPLWSIEASYSYVKTENNEDNAGFVRDPKVMPNNYRFGLRYSVKKWNVDLTARGGSGADVSEYVSSSYITMDLAAQYKVNKAWKVYGKIYNLNNAAYAEQSGIHNGSYIYPVPGRWFFMGVQYTF